MLERIRCNECGKKNCNSYDNLRVALGCSTYVALPDFKTPMLVHLMQEDKAQNTMEVLEYFKFELDEIGTYPYFRLYPKGRGK